MEVDGDPTQLFESLMGEVSDEQWEAYKELKRVGDGLIMSDGSDVSSDSEGEVDVSAMIQNTEQTQSITKSLAESTLDSGAESTDDEEEGEESKLKTDSVGGVKWEADLTVKYIDGKISFDEFADIMEKTNAEQDETDSPTKRAMTDISAGQKFDEELEEMKKKKKRKRRGQLPKDLQGLMGEANLCFVRGDHEDAIKMCMEVIRLVPRAAEPFQTLGVIYEEMCDLEKSYQFTLIGAYLSPNDPEEWVKLAQMSLERDNVRMAITCYGQALRTDKSNINLHWERSNLYEKVGEKKKAMAGYEAIVQLLPPEQGNECMQLCREVAKLHHENGNFVAAINILEKTTLRCIDHVTSEDVNMLIELQIGQKQYVDVLRCLRRHCGVCFEGLDNEGAPMDRVDDTKAEEYSTLATKCSIPEALPIDLQAKLAVALIQLDAVAIATPIVATLLSENCEEVGDLFLDVAESYMDVKQYQAAIGIFKRLIMSTNYNLAAVWLRYAESLHALNYVKEAAQAYEKVVQMAPLHYEARVTLAMLLKQLGKVQQAVVTLTQDYEEGKSEGIVIDAKLLWHSCNLLYEQGIWSEYVPAVKLLLCCHSYPATTVGEFKAIINCINAKHRWEALKELAGTMDCSTGHPTFTNDNFESEEMYDFYCKVFVKLSELSEFDTLQTIALRCLSSKLLTKYRSAEITFMAMLACYYNANFVDAYLLVKDMAVKLLDNNKIWNFFAHLIVRNEDMRHNRFCLRLMLKHPLHKALSLINGHTALTTGSYKNALGEYMYIYADHPNDAMLCLSIGVTFIHIAAQKFSLKRHSILVQGCAFLKRYCDLRGGGGGCQETFYNMGRAMHALGLSAQAIHYYKKALAQPPILGEENGMFDLRHEIAFNLALIYRASDADPLARMYVQKYCTI